MSCYMYVVVQGTFAFLGFIFFIYWFSLVERIIETIHLLIHFNFFFLIYRTCVYVLECENAHIMKHT